MILPTKGITPDRSILAVGSDLLDLLDSPLSVSNLWSRYLNLRKQLGFERPVNFDWFVLTLDFLFSIGAINLDDRGRLVKHRAS